MDAMILSQNPPARKENHLGEEREACGMGSLHFEIGKKFTLTKTFAESDVYLFAGIIGDLFPAHVNEEFCKRMPYGTRLVHGCLAFSLCSTVSGMAGVDSGHDILAMGYDQVKFLKPVFFGDTITATYWITEVNEARRKTTGQCVMTNQRGETVLTCLHYMKVIDPVEEGKGP